MTGYADNRQADWLALAIAVLAHALAVLLFWLISIDVPNVQEESGVPVMLGNMGNLDTDYDLTEVMSAQSPALPVPQSETVAPDMITQNLEETVALENGAEKKAQQKTEPVHQPTAEEIRKQQEQKAAAEANDLMAGLFNQGASSSTATENTGVQGTPGIVEGNATAGKTTGTGGYGTWDLGGRDMLGSLPRPAYEGIQDEGRVVVTIVVNPEGHVISTQINNRTNTINQKLRDAAQNAARQTRFNAVEGVNNQSGTITYYFKLR